MSLIVSTIFLTGMVVWALFIKRLFDTFVFACRAGYIVSRSITFNEWLEIIINPPEKFKGIWVRGSGDHNSKSPKQCPECDGEGTKLYSSTLTYHPNISKDDEMVFGGCAMTRDVCDMCWGSGDCNNPNESLLKED